MMRTPFGIGRSNSSMRRILALAETRALTATLALA